MVFSKKFLNLIDLNEKNFGVGYPDIQWIIHIQSIDPISTFRVIKSSSTFHVPTSKKVLYRVSTVLLTR
jgi:hypothetical protein